MKWWLVGIILVIAAMFAWDYYSRSGMTIDLVIPANDPARAK